LKIWGFKIVFEGLELKMYVLGFWSSGSGFKIKDPGL
jgi:hypothetical protein